ncbi:MAG: DNA topoisomerase I, partial [Thermoprotei archaeon]
MLRDYVLIIAEKPKAAQKIAYALAGAKAKKYSYKGIPYWVFRQNGQVHIVAPSAGHLFTLSTDLKGYPVVNYRWV